MFRVIFGTVPESPIPREPEHYSRNRMNRWRNVGKYHSAHSEEDKESEKTLRAPHPAVQSPQGWAQLASHWQPLCHARGKGSMPTEMHLFSSGALVADMAAHAPDTMTRLT